MVLAFLQAEINSARFREKYLKNLGILKQDLSLIEKADLKNKLENENRKKLLNKTRGFTSRKWLFKSFPLEVTWFLVSLSPKEGEKIWYAGYKDWKKLAGGTRKASEGAKNLYLVNPGYNHKPNVEGVVARLKKGETFPYLISATDDWEKLILLEGHTRATAYFLHYGAWPKDKKIIVGYSKNLKNWRLY